jgi:hypothetical protein
MPNEPCYVLFASDHPKPMGDTLLEYAQPLIARLPPDHTFEELKATIVFAALVWNIGLFDEVPDAIGYLAKKMPPRLRLRGRKGWALIREMLTTRDVCFGGDGRAALDVQVDRNGAELRVEALGIEKAPQPDSSPQDCELCEVALAQRERYLH